MRLVITGNRGFIGTHLQKRLEKDGHEIIGIDLKDGRDILNLTPDDLYGVDYVFHLAAQVSVPESLNKPIKTTETNALGTVNVLECARKAGVKRVIFSSTCAIYGINEYCDKQNVAYKETLSPNPLSPYGATKLFGEQSCHIYSESLGLDTVCLRYFNVFGEGMKADSQYSAAIAIFLDRKNKNESLPIYGGKQRRDFVYVEDVVEANILAMKYEYHLCGISINVGTGVSYSIEEIAEAISDSVIFYDQRKGEMNHVKADIELAKNLLGWNPQTDVMNWLEKQCVQ